MIKWLRQHYTGVSWRNPFISLGFRLIDLPDFAVRAVRGLGHLPRYSIRVRSRGVANQFGGRLFAEQGEFMSDMLQEYGGLQANADVVEIGCGCGCAAIGLSRRLGNGTYRGLDIDSPSIAACRANPKLDEARFQFDWLDVHSAQYNPTGRIQASGFEFPYDRDSADFVFLTSVFTHMLPDAVGRYLSEIARILRPGGRLLFTAFLMDRGTSGSSIDFPYQMDHCWLHQKSVPERAVGYMHDYLVGAAADTGLFEAAGPVYGNWRDVSADGEDPEQRFGQDILVFEKNQDA